MNTRTPARATLLTHTEPSEWNAMPTQYLTTPEGRLAFDDTHGHGPVILAIPGMGDLRGQYRHLTPLLVEAGYRVITMDIRGHGDTTARWNDYSAQAVARDALALLDHLGVQRAVLLGNSFAAGSALWAAHDQPRKVGGLVLLGPVTRDLPTPWYMRLVIKAAFGGPWSRAFWMTYRKTLFPARQPDDFDTYEASVRANLGQSGRMQALTNMIFLPKAPTEPLLSAVRKPTLVVMGTKDPDFKDATAEARLVADRTQADLMLVEGAGHYPHVEFPEQVAPRLLAFLGKLN
ncbi:alpha/beta fold hydrolase [Deinococcus yavapaiensis]|uniref:Pimeloyl-ACP methyl ester carboxylesterase n=1 Tax=Deinococcus yavapaiensis KR-236 TaxID=694435 RepID=A0A318SHD6_9DEIO|nr:alpha/beta hydrolase [Deinococcus yavapaiensis]PYE50412.1 pimeloyl-ACP methyl ester carboxylesterase [Deinococcus yavapaiensis KR-236]